jgi:hypothetical protein
MTIDDIISDVLVVIDDGNSEGDYMTELNATMTTFVKMALDMLAGEDGVTVTAKTSTTNSATYTKRPDGLYYTTVSLPSDYSKMVSVKMDDWVRPVTRLLPIESQQQYAQWSSAAGVGNGPKNPIAFLSDDSSAFIELHASNESSGKVTLKYLPSSLLSNKTILLDDKYRGAIVYMTAALYHESIQEAEQSQNEMNIAREYIKSEATQQKGVNNE